MFGFVPAWIWWVSGGWAAKSALDKMKPPAGQRAGMPGGQPGVQGAPAPMAQTPIATAPVAPQPPMVYGPPQPRPGPKCKFDAHMDERTERACIKYLQASTEAIQRHDAVEATKLVATLRGFADSVTDKLPPQAYPYGYFPVAATMMRMQADIVEQQVVAMAAAAAAAPPPAPPPFAKQANGVAAAPVTAIVATAEANAQPAEG